MSTISASTTSTTAFKITTDTTGALVFQTGASPTTAVTFDGSQNVGLGATPSAWGSGLKVIEFGGSTGYVAFNGTNASGYTYYNMWYDGTNNKTKQTGYIGAHGFTATGQYVWFNGSGTTGTTSSLTQAMTLDTSGNLGVGQTSPSGRLDVRTGSAGNYAQFIVGLSGGSSIYYDANTHYFRDGSFTERMRLDSSGILLLASTSANSYANYTSFQIGSGSAGSIVELKNSAGTGGGHLRLATTGTTINSLTLETRTTVPLILGVNSTERSRIDSSGNFLVGATSVPTGSSSFMAGNSIYVDGNLLIGNSGGTSTNFFRWDGYINSMYGLWSNGSADTGVRLDYGSTSWAVSSDERLKDIIEPITNAAEKISTMRTVIGKYKSDEPDKRRAFLIAQDVQAVLPEAVSEGIAPNGTEAYLWLAYQDVIPLLVAAIKELNTRLEAVENK